MSQAVRHTALARPLDESWSQPDAFRRAPGFTLAGAAARGESLTEATTVVFEGTVLGIDAPDAAWTTVWSAELSGDEPVAVSGETPLYFGAFRFLRWRLVPNAAPESGAAIHIALDGDIQE